MARALCRSEVTDSGAKLAVSTQHTAGIGRLETEILNSNFILLSINLSHIRQTTVLPLIHRDLFDRILVAQAHLEDLTIVTHDRRFRLYDVPLLLT